MDEETDLIEQTVLDYLDRKLSCPVYLEYPDGDAPDRFVVADRTDGSCDEGIESAIFTVQSYGKTKLDAALLNHQVKGAMDGLDEMHQIASCEMSNDYPFFDDEHKKYRYMAVYEIVYY